MKILSVADVSIQKVIGGAERMLYEQSIRMAQKGHQIHILTRLPQGEVSDQYHHQQVTERRYRVDTRNPATYLLSTLKNSTRLFESMTGQSDYGCIHFHQPFSAAGVLRSRNAENLPKLYSHYSLSFEEFVSRNPMPTHPVGRTAYLLNKMIRKRLEKWVLQRCHTIIVLSGFSRKRLYDAHRIHSGKTILIPGGVDTTKFRPAPDKLAIRRRLQLPGNRVILFTVRNLVPRMGLENLILAVKEASQTAPNLFLVLAGEGPLSGRLRDLAVRENVADNVRFTGYIPEGELPSYYQMADLFVLPTKELEGFGLVILESLSSGVPVIGTPVGGTNEILGRFNSKFIFKDTSAGSMARSILDCYHVITEKPQQWNHLSDSCRKFVEDNYSWKASIDALEKVYQKCVRR